MKIPKKRLAVLREHIEAESTHNMEELLEGMTSDCFNDVCCVPKPFVGPKQVAERYLKHWARSGGMALSREQTLGRNSLF
jgi:hypothetical protein